MAGASGTSSLAGEAVVVVVGAASLGGAASAAKGVPGLDATLLECLEFGVAGIPSPTPTLPIGVCAIAMVGSAATESLAAASRRSWAAFSLLNVAIVLRGGFTVCSECQSEANGMVWWSSVVFTQFAMPGQGKHLESSPGVRGMHH